MTCNIKKGFYCVCMCQEGATQDIKHMTERKKNQVGYHAELHGFVLLSFLSIVLYFLHDLRFGLGHQLPQRTVRCHWPHKRVLKTQKMCETVSQNVQRDWFTTEDGVQLQVKQLNPEWVSKNGTMWKYVKQKSNSEILSSVQNEIKVTTVTILWPRVLRLQRTFTVEETLSATCQFLNSHNNSGSTKLSFLGTMTSRRSF